MYTPHWLHHPHAIHVIDRGAPVHLVKETLGHANIATTGRYLHARPADSSSLCLDSPEHQIEIGKACARANPATTGFE